MLPPVLAVLTNISCGFNIAKKVDYDRMLNCPRVQTCWEVGSMTVSKGWLLGKLVSMGMSIGRSVGG